MATAVSMDLESDAQAATSSSSSSSAAHAESLPMILCCLCGAKIQSNPSNMCVNCLRGQVDITRGISKQLTLFWCRGCGRYNKPPYVQCELESRELLALCLKKIKGISKDCKLVDAGFVWTEPHSRRIKVKCTIQKEVYNATIMQQTFIVEFVVTNQQCTDCQKSYTEHTWNTVVQVRQKVRHKRTFFWLEQLLLKHSVVEKAINVKEQPEGLDFYWGHKNQAMHLLSFLNSVVPIRWHQAKRLISQDVQSNVDTYKFTIMVELIPICKDDVVLIPAKLSSSLGGCSPVLLCIKVTSCLHLIDPVSLKRIEMNADRYWRAPFPALMNSRQLQEFVVLDVTKASPNAVNQNQGGKFALAEVQIARSSDIGVNDTQFTVMSHLGNILKPGDTVMGYDLSSANITDSALTGLKGRDLPDVILVRKSYPNHKNRERSRRYKLKSLPKEAPEQMPKKHEIKRIEEDYEEFLKDIDEDPEMRSQINLYRHDKAGVSAAASAAESKVEEDAEDDDFPEVKLDELLDELSLSKPEDEEMTSNIAPDDEELNDLDESALPLASVPSKQIRLE